MEKIDQENIRLLREKMNLNQEDLAKYLGVKREIISYYETGSRQAPLDVLEKLADFFGVELADLIGNNKDVLNIKFAFALRSDELEKEDLEVIAGFKKVVLNYLKMKDLLKKAV